MAEVRYGMQKRCGGMGFDQAVEKATAALAAEGFGVLTRINVKETLKEKIGADFRPYVILGACNPRIAHKALEAEEQVGLLLPCNVVVQESPSGGGIVVSIQDPRALFSMIDNPGMGPMADEVYARLQRVLQAIG
jgi:uncharacterized protein (DUF302 family)